MPASPGCGQAILKGLAALPPLHMHVDIPRVVLLVFKPEVELLVKRRCDCTFHLHGQQLAETPAGTQWKSRQQHATRSSMRHDEASRKPHLCLHTIHGVQHPLHSRDFVAVGSHAERPAA
jgi:hypothetical protein